MGVVIKSRIDGFRRAGIAHRVEGTYYPDGVLAEQQLAAMRADPSLMVVEGVQEDTLQADQGDAELLQEMGSTIASLEHQLGLARSDLVTAASDLDQARAGLQAACSNLVAALDRQKAAPALVVEGAKALPPADPTQEGVICISADILATLVADRLLPPPGTPEEQDDGRESTLSTASESPSPAPVPAVAPATGDQPAVVNTDKVAAKRGAGAARNKGAE